MHSQIADEFHKSLTLQADDNDDDDSASSSDFQFSLAGATNSPVPAEEIFHNGQIRPNFPFCGDNSEEATTSYGHGPPVRKLFVVSSPERDDVAEGPYCAWSSEKKDPAPAPEMSRKSNSTGFSKLWRFRDLLVRSNSDGKDAFVFLSGKGDEKMEMAVEKEKKREKAQRVKVEGETASSKEKKTKKGKEKKEKSAFEELYGKREKKGGKRKSYLPYKQDLVGFFTNVNGMSRNVHPY